MIERGLAFLWHPPEGGYAGGFIAARRFFELQPRFRFMIVDSDATDLQAIPERTEVIRIREQWLRSPFSVGHVPMRVVNWIYHTIACLVLGTRHARDADFIFVPTSEIPCVTLPAVIVAAIFKKPLILINLNVEGQIGWPFNRLLHRRASAILTISRALANDLRLEVPGVPVDIFPIGTDDGSVERASAPVYDAIFIGRHVREKGIFDLLKIWAHCCRLQPTLRLAMVGPCEPLVAAELGRQIASLGLLANIALHGPVSEDEKWRLYATSRVCVFPSFVEGWGIVPLEAHLAGLPVVAYALPAYDEHIVDSPSATLVMLGDVEGFAEATLAYLATPPDAANTARWARRFTWEGAVAIQSAALERSLVAPADR